MRPLGIYFLLSISAAFLYGMDSPDVPEPINRGLIALIGEGGVRGTEDSRSETPSGFSGNREDEAYEHNRAGMINMSMARFEEAIAEFDQAAALYSDYQIRGRPLAYTPIFMIGWAYEKIGKLGEACRHYRKFLQLAPPGIVEESKAIHAREVINTCSD